MGSSTGIGELSGLGSDGGRPRFVRCLRSCSASDPGCTGEPLVSTERLELTEVASVVGFEDTLRVEVDRRNSLSPSNSSIVSASETPRLSSSGMKCAEERR